MNKYLSPIVDKMMRPFELMIFLRMGAEQRSKRTCLAELKLFVHLNGPIRYRLIGLQNIPGYPNILFLCETAGLKPG